MKKIAVSACLLGIPCRYDGQGIEHERVKEYVKDKEVVLVCPEVLGGLPTPRVCCERCHDKVMSQEGVDKTKYFVEGANKTLAIVLDANVEEVILKSKSPSCGIKQIYDGSFTSQLVEGMGVCAQLLQRSGIHIIDSDDI